MSMKQRKTHTHTHILMLPHQTVTHPSRIAMKLCTPHQDIAPLIRNGEWKKSTQPPRVMSFAKKGKLNLSLSLSASHKQKLPPADAVEAIRENSSPLLSFSSGSPYRGGAAGDGPDCGMNIQRAINNRSFLRGAAALIWHNFAALSWG